MSNCIFILCTVVDRRFYSRNYYYFRFVFLLRTVYVYVYSIANCFKYHHTKHLSFSVFSRKCIHLIFITDAKNSKFSHLDLGRLVQVDVIIIILSTLVFIDSINNNLTQLESTDFFQLKYTFFPIFFSTHISMIIHSIFID